MLHDYKNLIDLIQLAKGDRSINAFARDCDLDAGNLCRILNGKFLTPPAPETLKKIAIHSGGKVTYDELLLDACYISTLSKNETILKETNEELKELGNEYYILNKNLKEKGLTSADVIKIIEAVQIFKGLK